MELLANPRLLILDEPTSGLSPDLDRSMMELCRRLSHQNCTVLMVTHNMSNINLCDKIAFLGVGGVLCYYGAPEKLNEYFDVEMTSDILKSCATPRRSSTTVKNTLRPRVQPPAGGLPGGSAGGRQAMQPVKFLKFLRQFVVLVERNLQLIWNDKLLLASLTLQSPFMVLVVKLTADPNCFTSNLVNIGSRTALFILAAMATFMGTLNSYREICREREIILREASVGVSLPAVVLSKAAVLLLVEVLQAAILALGFVSIVHVPQNHLLLETDMEIFITVLLTMFSSSCIGLLISALFTSGESAILAVLVLMIGQVVFSNIMFTVTGAAATISNIIVCRWGMGALGASTDLNSRMAWLQAGLDGPMYDATVENLTHSWQMLGLISVVCLVAAWLVLQIAFDKKKV
ncbi:ABC transporter permease [Gemmiger formicilis]|nr:ABC transporter permease [Gemmiger formicilis]